MREEEEEAQPEKNIEEIKGNKRKCDREPRDPMP